MGCQTMNGLVGPEINDMSERQNRRYREARDDPYEEIPTPPTLVRQAAVTGPREGLFVREQELQFIAEHGMVAFCQGIIVTALLEDADYLLAQLTYLGRR
jgi:hypothetical protein